MPRLYRKLPRHLCECGCGQEVKVNRSRFLRGHHKKKYTDNELLNRLRRFENEEGRLPTETDFINNPEYPYYKTYQKRFGSWNKALEKAFGINRDKYD